MPNKIKESSINLEFDDNIALINLFGRHDQNLLLIEKLNGVSINRIGNKVNIRGDLQPINDTQLILKRLYKITKNGEDIDEEKIKDAKSILILNNGHEKEKEDLFIETRKKKFYARTENQKNYLKALNEREVIFVIGPAGTGKTYLAVAKAVSYLQSGRVNKIILSRPAVEAGERLGFLPGDMREKVDPYLRPIYYIR